MDTIPEALPRWWRKPVPAVRTAGYKLHQLFVLRYELEDEPKVLHNF